MMHTLYTPTHHVTTLRGSDMRPDISTCEYLAKYEGTMARLLQDAGFTGLQFHSLDKLRGRLPESEAAPDITGLRNGAEACICFAPLAGNMMQVTHLSPSQCDYCDAHHPRADVYFAEFFYSRNDNDEQELILLGPVPVKQGHEWMRDRLQHSQYLPISMRDGMDRYSAIYNGGVLFKIYQAVFPRITSNGSVSKFGVSNLFDNTQQGETDYLALNLFPVPTVMALIQHQADEKALAYTRSFFMHCGGPKSDLELVSMDEETDEADGVVSLMDCNGAEFKAECLEVVLYRPRIRTGCRYLWTTYLAAERFSPLDKEICITSGPVFEMHKEEYRREHGCEPPEDFAFRVSLEHTRFIMQHSDDCYSEVTGQVISVESTEVDAQPMQLVCIHPLPENDDVVLQVFVSPEVMGDYTPAVGDTVHCTGYLTVSPDDLLQDVPGWQDSVVVGERLSERDADREAHRVFESLATTSLGHAVAAAAFVRGGWDMKPVSLDALCNARHALHFTSQSGQLAVVFVKTLLNGAEPEMAYIGLESLTEQVRQKHGDDALCCLCRVRLDYKPTAERYAVSMEMEPECPGVENTLLYCACPFHETILDLDSGERQRQRPEHLDESMVAGLFRAALAEGHWADFARWMREEADYTSESNDCHFGSKLDFLRYMDLKVDSWKNGDGKIWAGAGFHTGSVIWQGRRRPCTATLQQGSPVAITVFDDDGHGMIGHIHNLPPTAFDSLILNTSANEIAPDEPLA